MVNEDDLFGIHESRSKRAQAIDEALKAPIADSMEQWADDPDEFDWPGVDTPSAETDRAVMEFNEGNIGLKDLGERLSE